MRSDDSDSRVADGLREVDADIVGVQERGAHRLFGRSVAAASFPSVLPLLRLERIWIRPAAAWVGLCARRCRTARRASDHLPVVAELVLDDEPTERGRGTTPARVV